MEEHEKSHSVLRFQKLIYIIPGGFLTVLLAAFGIYYANSIDTWLPGSVIRSVHGFRVYYFRPSPQVDFTYQKNSAHYRDGVLVFGMFDPAGKKLAVTEQRVPPGYDVSANAPQSDGNSAAVKPLNTEYGLAYIIDAPDHTAASLFTTDNTWVVINAPDPIGADTMQAVIDALSPR